MKKINAINETLVLTALGLLQPLIAKNLKEFYLNFSQQNISNLGKKEDQYSKARDQTEKANDPELIRNRALLNQKSHLSSKMDGFIYTLE